MAPNLAPSQHDLIRDMILHQTLTTREMADAAGCSERCIKAIRSNLHYFGTTKAPPNGGGRHPSITLHMLEVLSEQLLEKPELYLEEMTVFLWDEFDIGCSTHLLYMNSSTMNARYETSNMPPTHSPDPKNTMGKSSADTPK
jgi:hypothetical protein